METVGGIHTFRPSLYFAPFLEKVLDVQWLLQWMVWPLLATDIQTKRSAESCLETNFYFPNFFLGGEIFLCRLMIWRPVTGPFAISQIQMFWYESFSLLICFWLVRWCTVCCTIKAWKNLLHTLDWRPRRKYLLYRIEMSTHFKKRTRRPTKHYIDPEFRE